MQRRDFIKLGGLLAAGSTAVNAWPSNHSISNLDNTKNRVYFFWDGIYLSPTEYTTLLMRLVDEGKIKADYYSNGGIVEELEHKFAQLLGKESAVFMPTGTLANHIAIRELAASNKRAITQERSHIYNDSGDCVQKLSGINLIPLGKDKVCFSVEELKEAVRKTAEGRVESGIGVITFESPVRRKFDRIIPYNDLKLLADYARLENIRLHMDGARLFVQAVHENRPPHNYGELFDTVYTSMWKCFNAASGAILAGSNNFTDGLYHTRRMFGGGLPFVWPFAAVALHFADSFIDEYKSAFAKAERLFTILQRNERFIIEQFNNGTHIVSMQIIDCNFQKFKNALSQRKVDIGNLRDGKLLLKVNPTLNRMEPEIIAEHFNNSLQES